MAENLQYTLTLTTLATGDGARKTAKEMGDVAAAKQHVEDLSKRFLTAAEAEVAEIDRLVRAAQRLQDAQNQNRSTGDHMVRTLQDTTDKARVAEFAYYNLDEAIAKGNKSLGSFNSGAGDVGKVSANASRGLLMFSQGFEDAQYGMRGVLNNIPGLVMALGGTAGLAGAISIGAVSFSILYDWLHKTEEKTTVVADRIKAFGEAMGKVEADRFQKVGDDIKAAKEATDALKQSYDQTHTAENEFATSALDNAGKIAEAQRHIAEALHLQVSSFEELENNAQADAAKRKLAAEQAIAAENEKLAKAREAKTEAADAWQQAQQRKDIESSNLVELEAQLATLRAQKTELEKIAKERVTWAEALAEGSALPGQKTARADKAQKDLDKESFKELMAATEARVEQLREDLFSIAKDTQTAENAFNVASGKLFDLQNAAKINVQRINETLAADTLLADSKTAVARSEALATEIKGFADSVTSSSENVIKAKEVIQQKVEDGKVTADELVELARAQSTLMTALYTGTATTNQNIQSLILLARQIQNEQKVFAKDIQELQRR